MHNGFTITLLTCLQSNAEIQSLDQLISWIQNWAANCSWTACLGVNPFDLNRKLDVLWYGR